jgi:hypothetical protein
MLSTARQIVMSRKTFQLYKAAQEDSMISIISIIVGVLFLAVTAEITTRVNSPADARIRIDSYKFQPEFGHIHECESGC